jgi:starvation-inducible DNA-binding protein
MSAIVEKLSVLLADTYAIYLKTQNYHWHVRGPQFKTLHELFEEHYTELAMAVDELAERIRILGHNAPATFNEFNQLKTITDGDANASANEMVIDLHQDHQKIIDDLYQAIEVAQENNDEGSIALLSERIAAHEKARWMLGVSIES